MRAECISARPAARSTRRRTRGDNWAPIVRDLPAVLSVEVQTLVMIRVVLPAHLRTLARVNGEVELEVEGPVTQRSVLDALEERYPVLRGTIRDHVTQQRRPFLRFFACAEDLSHEPPDAPLPEAVVPGGRAFSGHRGGGGRLSAAVSHSSQTRLEWGTNLCPTAAHLVDHQHDLG